MMIIKRKVGPKGQIVIPKDARELLHIKPGSEILMEILDDEIILRASKDVKDFLPEFIKTPKKLDKTIDYKKILDEQYNQG